MAAKLLRPWDRPIWISSGEDRQRATQKVSVAQVTFACGPMQAATFLIPYQPRPVGPLRRAKFDIFAPVSGKQSPMVVVGKGLGAGNRPG